MKFIPLLLLSIYILSFVPLAQAGDEDYINGLLVHYKGQEVTIPAGTYYIKDTVIMPDNTVLKGETENGELKTIIILADNVDFDCWQPLIDAGSNVEISYLDIRANSKNQNKVPYWKGHNGKGNPSQTGQGYHNIIQVKNKHDVKINHLQLSDGLGDGVRVISSQNVEIDHCEAWELGHDAFFFIRSESTKIHDCYINQRVNSAIRGLDVYGWQVYSNVIEYRSDKPAGPGIQFQRDVGEMGDIEICGNVIRNSCGPGFWIVGKKGDGKESADIHDNIILNAGSNRINWTAGAVISGYDNLLLKNNVFDGCYRAAVYFYAYNQAWGTPATATLEKNIFTDSKPSKYDSVGGYGVLNEIGPQKVESEKNCYWGNSAGEVSGCSKSASDISVDPKKEETYCSITWQGNEWRLPAGIKPGDMQNSTGKYKDLPELSDDDILKFDDIFDILSLDVTDSVNMSSEMPEDYEPVNFVEVMLINNSYNPQTRFFVPADNYTLKVSYKWNGEKSWYFVRAMVSGNLETVDTWRTDGEASHMGNYYVIPYALSVEEIKDVKITVYDAAENKHVIKNYNVTVYDEKLTDAVNPFLYFFAGFLLICLSCLYINIKAVYRRKRR